MGCYVNPNNGSFKQALNSEIYVDKSLLIEKTNEIIGSKESKLCVTRPRRFGKTIDANMLVAYYSKGAASSCLFDSLKISRTNTYWEHLNKYHVIFLNMQNFLSASKNMNEMIQFLSKRVIRELIDEFDLNNIFDDTDLCVIMENIYKEQNESFVFIIDEWDCVFRSNKKEDSRQYLDFLKTLLEDQPYIELVYMTGILPIKKCDSYHLLNEFKDVSMSEALEYSKFMGFTEDAVKELCMKYHMDLNDMKRWYHGYQFGEQVSIFSPRSVVYAIHSRVFHNYWTSSETYEALAKYITMDFDGMKEAVIRLLSGQTEYVDTGAFQHDMTTIQSKDDVLTLLVHLGYLGYDLGQKAVYIPNYDVEDSFVQSIWNCHWDYISEAVIHSRYTLDGLWNKDAEKVAQYIEQAHLETSIIPYNDENALAYTIYLAFLAAKNHYTMIRELPTGKGFADIAFIPFADKPAMIVELKWDQDANGAIKQIKEKHYPASLEKYRDDLIMAEIAYDRETKKHTCVIE